MLDWCIVTLASARLKASLRFPPLRGMYQRGGTCKGCDRLPCLSGIDGWRANSAAPSPSVASSAAQLQIPQVAWLLLSHRDGGV